MRLDLYKTMLLGFVPALLAATCTAGVIDRVAIVIDKVIITESEVENDLRITEFLNNEPLDVGPAARRAAAERLVDQELIRRELENTGYAKPSAAEADQALRQFREQRFHFLADYHAALDKYGITEDALKQRLLWQLAALRFTDLRFRSQLPDNGQSADRAVASAAATDSIDERMDAWLKQARSNTRIAFKQEAFQ